MEWNDFWAVLMQACIAALLLGGCLGLAGYFIASGISSGIYYKEQRLAAVEAAKKEPVK